MKALILCLCLAGCSTSNLMHYQLYRVEQQEIQGIMFMVVSFNDELTAETPDVVAYYLSDNGKLFAYFYFDDGIWYAYNPLTKETKAIENDNNTKVQPWKTKKEKSSTLMGTNLIVVPLAG